MVPYFNVSSRGGSATHWIHGILAALPGVICLHGLYREEVTPEAVLADLRARREADTGVVSCGVVHRFYGTAPKQAFLAAGGTFSAIVRHPIARIHSLYSLHCENALGRPRGAGVGLYAALVRDGEIRARDAAEFSVASLQTMTATEHLFTNLVFEVVGFDREILAGGRGNNVGRFEALTTDPHYLVAWLEKVVGPHDALAPTVRDAFHGSANRHSHGLGLPPEQIFGAWPDTFKDMFVLALFGPSLEQTIAAYGSADYELPPQASEWIARFAAARVARAEGR